MEGLYALKIFELVLCVETLRYDTRSVASTGGKHSPLSCSFGISTGSTPMTDIFTVYRFLTTLSRDFAYSDKGISLITSLFDLLSVLSQK